jgi:peptidoglycan/LPS O-acetylase OafA/YrhL
MIHPRARVSLLSQILTINVSEYTSTSWLDGLRGYASLVVSLAHLRNGYTELSDTGYGSRPQDVSLLQLPIIRVIFAGPAMVGTFYFVSGYSLSWGAFKDLQKGSPERCLSRIRSSVFRRYLRLYIPVLWGSFLVLCCILTGLYAPGIATDSREFTRDAIPTIFDSPMDQIKDWMNASLEFSSIWKIPRHQYYVSIPYLEFTTC